MAALTAAYLTLFVLLIAGAGAASDSPATAYTNHTVGGPAGWFFNSKTNTSSANYSSWAGTQSFNLGDYLIFNTSSNQTVIRTYNLTTFQNCSIDDDYNPDTIQYGGGEPGFDIPSIILVPLVKEGTNYFFSDAYDGVQCQNGMAFKIQVSHGLGLPPSLNQPPPPPYTSPPGPDSAESPSFTFPTPPGNGGSGISPDLRAWLLLLLLLAFF